MGSDFESNTYAQYATYAKASIESNVNTEKGINNKINAKNEFRKKITKYINIFFSWIDN